MGAMLGLLTAYELGPIKTRPEGDFNLRVDSVLFGCPRIGNMKFTQLLQNYYNKLHTGYLVNFWHEWDPVEKYPSSLEGYVDACDTYRIVLHEDRDIPWLIRKVPAKLDNLFHSEKKKKKKDVEKDKRKQLNESLLHVMAASRYHSYSFYSRCLSRQQRILLGLPSPRQQKQEKKEKLASEKDKSEDKSEKDQVGQKENDKDKKAQRKKTKDELAQPSPQFLKPVASTRHRRLGSF